ncbi:unnamed protein product [Mesocestoides corti]|uniref:Ecdysone-induced protein 74EF n=1 Tax=Mesocestoides corti TaxID=53468 RepID=A0A0R3UMF8_MESCO|nr:unnamed protein product [Mesocestoides corti]
MKRSDTELETWATNYPVPVTTGTTQPRGLYRDQMQMQYSSSTCSNNPTPYRVDNDFAATPKLIPPSSHIYMGEVTYQQQRWQQQQAQMVGGGGGGGGDMYIQQSQHSSSSSSVMMVPPTPQSQQYYMAPPTALPNQLQQHQQQMKPHQPPPQSGHSRAYPALM